MARQSIKSKVAQPEATQVNTILPKPSKASKKAGAFDVLDPRWGQDEDPNKPGGGKVSLAGRIANAASQGLINLMRPKKNDTTPKTKK